MVAVALVVANDPRGSLSDFFSVSGIVAVAWASGVVLHERMRRTEELEARAARLERERESQARTAVAEERARIAREMHDVVAHSLSVMVVQPARPPRRCSTSIPSGPAGRWRRCAARRRSALGELRACWARCARWTTPAPRCPPPGLDGLDDLVESVCAPPVSW